MPLELRPEEHARLLEVQAAQPLKQIRRPTKHEMKYQSGIRVISTSDIEGTIPLGPHQMTAGFKTGWDQ